MENVRQRLMVRNNVKGLALQKVPEVLDDGVTGEQLTTKKAVARLGVLELPSEETQRVPLGVDSLLENSADCNAGSIQHDASGDVGSRVDEKHRIGDGLFSSVESGLSFGRPGNRG